MKIGLAQINTTVGDLAGNHRRILGAYQSLIEDGAEIVVMPELAVTGYPPQDLVFKSRFVPLNLAAIDMLQSEVGDVPLLAGYVENNAGPGRPFRNAAAILQRGREPRRVFKSLLPTYDVFNEDRYFQPAASVCALEIAGRKVGVTICEDIWTEKYLPRQLYDRVPVDALVEDGAELILNLSASPFTLGKAQRRYDMLSELAARHRVPIIYCNAVGGNDQLIFDGNSLAVAADGSLLAHLPPFEESLAVVDTERPWARDLRSFQSEPEELHGALCLGLRDYLHKCGFKSAVIGLSGGIDSAVVAALAAHALGPENVLGVTMPTQYSSPGSIDDSKALAANLGLQFWAIPIGQSFEAIGRQMAPHFAGLDEDTTEENIQPRLRGLTLMAISNKFGHLLLSTGNKSELAVGYCTLYGDMCGGLAVISDVPKTMVYRLAEFINREREIIPRNTITKPPSAELKPDQRDQDTLPPYEVLDPILQLYVEEQKSVSEILSYGFAEETVRWVQRRVDLNEYKRAQAVPGLKVTSRAFGLGRRMPVAQRFVE
ncbi:MAG: NAD+ synthase [Chthoniobacteraceae bacterium]